MRPLQHWLHGRVSRLAWQRGTLRVRLTPACCQTSTPWSDLSFLWAGVPLEQVSSQALVYTGASAKGWGATFNGLAVSGVWMGPQLHWHINCLELLAVHLALNHLKRRLRDEHVLVRMDNTATVAYINRQGGLSSRCMSQLARHLLLWSQKHLRSLRVDHIKGLLNRAADELSRAALPREWRLHPQTVQLIWRRFGLTQVNLFASPETSHCQLFFSLLVVPYWPTRTWFLEVMLLVTILADYSEEGSADSETGHLVSPASRLLETSCLIPGWNAEVLVDQPMGWSTPSLWRERHLRDMLTP